MASQLLPKGTAREYAQMMAQIASRRLISREVSEVLRQKLENVPSDWPLRVLFYDCFGAKDGITPYLASTRAPTCGNCGNGIPRNAVLALYRECTIAGLLLAAAGHSKTDLAPCAFCGRQAYSFLVYAYGEE